MNTSDTSIQKEDKGSLDYCQKDKPKKNHAFVYIYIYIIAYVARKISTLGVAPWWNLVKGSPIDVLRSTNNF